MAPHNPPPDFDPSKALEEIARSAQHITGANGAALALSDGNVISCRACSGYLAPPVGTELNTDTGLTATCVQTAQVVRCDDTEADPRVDASKCVGIRSILVVPVFNDPNVTGVLEVLSSKPNRFTDRHVTALQLLARLVETHVNYVSRNKASLAASPSDAKPNGNDPAGITLRGVGCLSCGNRNPQGSQFCNRCGVILQVAQETVASPAILSLPDRVEARVEPIDQEGLREIYKLISGSAGLATWNDIYTKLLANLQTPGTPDRGNKTTPEETTKKEETVKRFGKTEASNELTAHPGVAIRRRLWL